MDQGLDQGSDEGLLGGLLGVWFFWVVFLLPFVISLALLAIAAFLAQVLLLALVALALIPAAVFPPARTALERLGLLLSNVVGDTYALKRSPFALAAMVHSLQGDLDWLLARSKRVVVVAHSQGSVIAHRALVQRPRSSVAEFVTVGSALRLLYSDAAAKEDEESIDRILRLPPSSAGSSIPWTDYYASADPVPDGRLWRRTTPPDCSSIEVRSADSLVRDHNLYWRNPDGFMALLVQQLDTRGDLGVVADQEATRNLLSRARRLRARRAGALTTARAFLGLAGLLLIPVLGGRVEDLGGLILADGASPVAAWSGGLALVLLGTALIYAVVALAWSRWNAQVAQRMHARTLEHIPRSPMLGVVLPQCAALLGVPALGIGLHGVSGATLALTALGIAGAIAVYMITAAANEDSLPKPRAVTKDDLKVGQELAYGSGSNVRHVRVAGSALQARHVRDLLFGSPLCVIEFLDENHPPGGRGDHGLARGQQLEVRRLHEFAGLWQDYVEWQRALAVAGAEKTTPIRESH